MGTYAGTDSFPSAVTIPDDAAAPTAANLLVSIEGALDRTVWLKNRIAAVRSIAAQNFHGFVSSFASEGWCAAAYEPTLGFWAVISQLPGSPGTHKPYVAYDVSGKQLLHFASADFSDSFTRSIVALYPVGAGVFVGLLADTLSALTNGNVTLVKFDLSGSGVATSVYTHGGGTVHNLGGRIAKIGSTFVYVAGGATLGTSPDGTTWTDHTANITASLVAVPDWDMCIANGVDVGSTDAVIALPRQVAGLRKYMISADGVTWSERSLSSSVVGASDVLQTIADGKDVDGTRLELIGVQKNAGGCEFWGSTNGGVTWTLRAALASFQVCSVRCMDRVWVAVEQRADRTGRTIYSIDGGVTWQWAPDRRTDATPAGSALYFAPRVHAGPAGFVVNNDKFLNFSFQAGSPPVVT